MKVWKVFTFGISLACISPHSEWIQGFKRKSSKNRKRNIIGFNPAFSKNVCNNIGKCFLLLIQKHFSNNHKYHEMFNKNNLNISYSCRVNIKSIINIHNKDLVTEKKTQEINFSCINKPDFPLSNQCQITKIVNKAKITSNF